MLAALAFAVLPPGAQHGADRPATGGGDPPKQVEGDGHFTVN